MMRGPPGSKNMADRLTPEERAQIAQRLEEGTSWPRWKDVERLLSHSAALERGEPGIAGGADENRVHGRRATIRDRGTQ
jgi:hypothetical protein